MQGSTIDTFSFTESGWSEYTVGTGMLTPDPLGTLVGSFTGIVEPDGFIEQGDLLQFSVEYTSGGVAFGSMPLNQLTLFSYDTNPAAGLSSLDFAGTADDPTNVCVGAATSLDAACTFDLTQPYAPGTVGAVELNGLPHFVSSQAPQITLASSVTTPEPASLFLVGVVLIAVATVGRRKLTP
jgi:hypothetical protein